MTLQSNKQLEGNKNGIGLSLGNSYEVGSKQNHVIMSSHDSVNCSADVTQNDSQRYNMQNYSDAILDVTTEPRLAPQTEICLDGNKNGIGSLDGCKTVAKNGCEHNVNNVSQRVAGNHFTIWGLFLPQYCITLLSFRNQQCRD